MARWPAARSGAVRFLYSGALQFVLLGLWVVTARCGLTLAVAFPVTPPMRCITHGKHSSTRRAGWTGRSTRGFGRTRLIRSDCSPPRDARRWHAAAAILWTSLVLANRVGIGAAGILPRSWLLALTRALPPPFRELIVPRLTRNSSLFGGTRERPDDVAMVVAVWVCAFCCWVQRAVPWMAASLGRLTVGPER